MSKEKKKVSFAYEEMLHMSHHVSGKHPQMSRYDRAAQFSPFAALTGHEAAVQEAARVTEERAELDEGEKERLNEILYTLLEKYQSHPDISVTYFCPDARKSGGRYVTETGRIQKLDTFRRTILLDNQSEIPMDQISNIQEK